MTARLVLDTATVQADRPMRVRDLVRHALRADVRFNSNLEGIRQGLRIAEAIGADAPAVDVVPGPFRVDEGDWEKLCDALRSPSPLAGMMAYPLSPGHACLPLIDQVLNASKAEP